MHFVPTVTRIWPRLDLEGVGEVLLTPRSADLPNYPSSIIIDNGCWSINSRKSSFKILDTHIELCKELAKDPRCIFVLPDIEPDPKASLYYLDLFLREVKPPRFSLVDMAIYLDRTDLIEGSEFLSIPARRLKKANFNLQKYHLLGTTKVNGARSWDDLDYDTENVKAEVQRRSR